MARYIITFRLEDTPTYNDRYKKFNDFLIENASDGLEDETTSTIFCKGENLAAKLKDANILNNNDEVLFIKTNENKQIVAVYRVTGSSHNRDSELEAFFN